jgi:fatty-acyl-CoA synthase
MSDTQIKNELIAVTTQLLAESGEPYKRKVEMDVPFQRLGIDSLARAELFSRIEKHFHLSLPDSLLAQAVDLNDVSTFIAANHTGMKKEKISRKIITEYPEHKVVDPHQAKTLVDILLLYADQVPNKPHIYFQQEDGQEEIITYAQMLAASLKVANGLRQYGLKERETVAIMQPTHLGFFYTFFGTLLAGGIPVPIYPPFRTYMLESYAKTEARILKSAEVRILVTFDKAENLSRLLQGFVPSLKVVTTANDLQKVSELTEPFKPAAEDFAMIQYTSGSTADPKGVLLAHKNLLANIAAYGKEIKINPKDVAVSWLPLYHDFGLIGAWFGSLYHGVPLILMTPFSFLNHPEKWLWAIHYHRGTISGAPNFAYDLCVRKIEPNQIEGLDLSSWRIAANGAEKVYPRTLQQFTDKFAPYGLKRTTILPVYGLAESTVCLTIPPLEREFRIDHIDRKKFEKERLAQPSQHKNALEFASCGLPLASHEVRIVDENNQALPERHVGNLQFRGPSNMQAYYNNPEATKKISHPDGWLDSGDLAYLADQEVFITGRYKDLIIKAGRNLYPAEIEELVGEVEGVRKGCVAAFGVTDDKKGTDQLVIVAETRALNKKEQLIADIKNVITMNLEIVPDQVILVKPHTVPKTSSGKLQRAACKSKYLQGKLGGFRMPPWLQVVKLSVEWSWQKLKNIFVLAGKLIYTFYMLVILLMTFIPVYIMMLVTKSHTAEKICRLWMKFLIFFSFCPRKIIGTENLTKTSPVIYAANHASYLDSLIILSLIPAGTYFVVKKELFSVPILRTFMHKLNYLAVDRADLSKGIEDTKQIEKILQQGHSIIIFPEGTFGYGAGLRPFRLGAFKIAVETNTAICPIALKGTRYILRDDEKMLQPGSLQVTISEPIKAEGNEWKDVTKLRQDVRSEIAKYCGEPSLDFIAAETVAPKSRI